MEEEAAASCLAWAVEAALAQALLLCVVSLKCSEATFSREAFPVGLRRNPELLRRTAEEHRGVFLLAGVGEAGVPGGGAGFWK